MRSKFVIQPELGIVRHARDCDYYQLEDLAAHHSPIRQFLGLPAIAGSDLTNTPKPPPPSSASKTNTAATRSKASVSTKATAVPPTKPH